MDNRDLQKNTYIDSLGWKLKKLLDEIAQLQKNQQEVYKQIVDKQDQSKKILSLLSLENIDLDNIDYGLIGNISISDLVFEYLDSSNEVKSFHYKDITNKLIAKGNFIPGKDPSANLLSQINKDERFIRVSSGMYALKKWDLPISTQNSRRKSKKRPARKKHDGQ